VADDLLARALALPWYHTIDLAPGAATTGAVDLRRLAPRVLPRRLDGLRALDVGTFDGFWAFTLEQRGAEVVATDVERFDQADWPPLHRAVNAREAGDRRPGERFGLAAELLGSRARRVVGAVQELDAALVGGAVDYAVMGDLLLHLRDPVGALERVRGVLRPGGRLLSLEQVSVPLTLLSPRRAAARFAAAGERMSWWEPNLRALRDYFLVAGFARSRVRRVYRLSAHPPQDRWHVAIEAVA
jgi:SAM-dependent methyltransferase